MRSPYTEYVASGLPNPTPLECVWGGGGRERVRFIQGQDQQMRYKHGDVSVMWAFAVRLHRCPFQMKWLNWPWVLGISSHHICLVILNMLVGFYCLIITKSYYWPISVIYLGIYFRFRPKAPWQLSQLMRLCASAQSHQSLRCLHTWSLGVDEVSDQKSDI